MHGDPKCNREQEIANISRGLKELNASVIALSLLNYYLQACADLN
ncbi:MAG: hypothetical protein ACRYFV_15525 [Janthinobacterium lividum]